MQISSEFMVLNIPTRKASLFQFLFYLRELKELKGIYYKNK